MLHELESSVHQTSGMCDSESGVSSPVTCKYSYHGTFGPGVSDNIIDPIVCPLAELLHMGRANALNRRCDESKNNASANCGGGLTPPKMKPPMVHLAYKFCQSEAAPNIKKNIGFCGVGPLNDSDMISSVNEVEEPDSNRGD